MKGFMRKEYCVGCNEQAHRTQMDHIIPQAIGGKHTLRMPLCRTCHREKIHPADTELTKCLHQIASLLDVERERGKHPPVEIEQAGTGIEFKIDSKTAYRARPEVRIQFDQDGHPKPYIRARSENEREEIIDGIRRKYGQSVEVVCSEERAPLGLVEYEGKVGGRQFMRSVAKSAFLYLATRLTINQISSDIFYPVREFIFNDIGSSLVSFNYVHTDFMVDENQPIHSIVIHFDSRGRNIVGYVQYFNVFRFSVLIAREFIWGIARPDIRYSINPMNGQEIEREGFVLPDITVEECLSPRQSEELVHSEIAKGHCRLNSYYRNIHQTEIEFLE
jgi:hypothetical protein